MSISVQELKDLQNLKHESSIVFMMVSDFIDIKSKNFLSFEGAVEATLAFEEAKKRLDKLYIVLKPEEGKEMIKELKQVEGFADHSFLLRAIKITEDNKQLFLAQDDREPLMESLIALNKFW